MEVPKRELSYRYYKRLSSKEKRLVDLSNLSPLRKLLAIYTYKKSNISLKKSLRLSEKFDTSKLSFRFEDNLKYVVSEFKFRGFIPISQYKMNKRFPYIITNFKIDGEFYIYPKRFGSTYKHLEKGYTLIEKVFFEYGVQGYTKILYGED